MLRETFFERFGGGGGGGGTQERFSNASNNRFFKQGHCQKTLSVRKNFGGNINLGLTSYLNFDKLGIGNNAPDCLLAPFTLSYGPTGLDLGRILRIVHNNTTAINDQ